MNPQDCVFPVPDTATNDGLDLRTYVAAHALAGLLAGDPDGRMDWLARRAVIAADELLRALRTDGQPSQAVPDHTTAPLEPRTPSDYDGDAD